MPSGGKKEWITGKIGRGAANWSTGRLIALDRSRTWRKDNIIEGRTAEIDPLLTSTGNTCWSLANEGTGNIQIPIALLGECILK